MKAVVSVQLCGCFSIAEFKKLFEDSGPRGLYSAGVAQDYFKLHTEALDAAADWFKANPNVVYVIKGADSSYDNRTYTKIGELGVFSSEELSQDEINGIQTFVQPLFDDPLMTSVSILKDINLNINFFCILTNSGSNVLNPRTNRSYCFN